jgi:two-component system, LytTR family, sensor histidine kinase AlgZ
MHPILDNRRRLAMYLAGWVPVGLFVTVGLGQGHAWSTSAALFLPLTFVYAFVCLSAWYVCRVFPLDANGSVPRAVFVHIIAAAMTSAIWVTLGEGWAATLDSLAPGLAARALHADQRSLIFVVGVLLFWLVTVFLYMLIAFQASSDAETRALELMILAREAELKALRAQIDPHFLFNSLNSISALTSSDPAAARHMCVLLAEFLRATLRLGSTHRITLSDEFDLAERFLSIERVRLGARLSIARSADEGSAGCLVPPLLLQPLVENAVVHGIAHLLEGGTVRMTATRAASTLTISMENPCDPDRPRRSGSGFGLDLLRKRVATQFGDAGAVRVDEAGGLFTVEVRIPAVTAA